MSKVVHITSVHPRFDTRIFYKECLSLYNKGMDVSLIVADGKGDQKVNGVAVYDVGKPKGRFDRILRTSKKIVNKAISLNADVYHIHDPELLRIVKKLSRNAKVVYDIHENIREQLKTKQYLPYLANKILPHIYGAYEISRLKYIDKLVLAEYSYQDIYKKLWESKVAVVLNMPDLEKLQQFRVENRSNNGNNIFYVGEISKGRGIDIILQAAKILKTRGVSFSMDLVGPYDITLLEQPEYIEVKDCVNFYGRIPIYDAMEFSKNAKVGLSILKPIGNFVTSYSTKIFEYMSVGLPVITSNFKLYLDVVEYHKSGICIDPTSSTDLADALEFIMSNENSFGINGMNATKEHFNWSKEEQSLLGVYSEFIKS